jgi:hemerythrin-like domain-containing protein
MGEAAMSFKNRISQTLHEEHRATVALVERLEALLAGHRREPPNAGGAGVAQLLADLATGMESEVHRHFDFEENRVFAYLAGAGDEAIGAHLADEHAAIRPIGNEIARLARAAVTQGFDAATWVRFARLGQELSQRLLVHVQKEEMVLLPLIEDTMDADTEARLYQEYMESA